MLSLQEEKENMMGKGRKEEGRDLVGLASGAQYLLSAPALESSCGSLIQDENMAGERWDPQGIILESYK